MMWSRLDDDKYRETSDINIMSPLNAGGGEDICHLCK